MGIDTTLGSILPSQFGYREARHLLLRAGFGGTPRQITTLVRMGLDDAVDHLVDYGEVSIHDLEPFEGDEDIIRPLTPEERMAYRKARQEEDQEKLDEFRRKRLRRLADDRRQMADAERWWLARMIETPRPLQEKLTLLWHGHFASNHRTVRDSYMMLQQNELFRSHANGNFADLVYGIIRDPAMLKFLNNNSNNRHRPNENLARELMELFTLGEGNYSERDIKEGARALTGYSIDDDDFEFREYWHDKQSKTILGARGNFDGEDFATILLRRRECAQFVAWKLYRFFVLDLDGGVTPSAKRMIETIANQLMRQKYEMAPVLKALFKSRHFYDESVVGNKIKSPAELVVGLVRSLGVPPRDIGVLAEAMGMMGQKLFDPPSVAGWDGGRAWINTSTLFVRQNLATYLITGKTPKDQNWERSDVAYDPMPLIEDLHAQTPNAVVDHLVGSLLAAPPPDAVREQLRTFLRDRGSTVTPDRLIAMLLLITAAPEYQLC